MLEGLSQEAAKLGYVNSWYASTLSDHQARPAITSAESADVVVVGGGLAGLTTALELLRLGKSVIVLERQRVAWGASGLNGGFVAPGFADGLEAIIKTVGIAKAQRLYEYSCQGVEYVRREATAIDPALIMGEGLISVSRYPNAQQTQHEVMLLNSVFSSERDIEPPNEHWSVEQVRSVLKSERYFDALYDRNAFHIHPLNYARGLATEIERLGGKIFEQSRVSALSHNLNGITCKANGVAVSGKDVVLCTSAYDRTLYWKASRAILPVATYIAVTEPLSEDAASLVNTHSAVADTRRAGDYYRMVDDQRLLWGGKITTRQSLPRGLGKVMQKTMSRTFAPLAQVATDYAWSGLMGYAVHNMPIITRLDPKVWVATAFGGHGLNTTAMAGCLIAKGIASSSECWRDFADYGPNWAGGPLGRAAVQGSYWGMRLRDQITEARAVLRKPL